MSAAADVDATDADGAAAVGDDGHPSATSHRREIRPGAWAASVVRVAVWVFVNVTVLLGAWVLIGWSIAGWSPVVITSGSMEPTLSVGDVLMVDTGSQEAIGQRTIVMFDRDGTTIVHRVFGVEGDDLVTKGDANASPDLRRIRAEDVDGVGRLIVPFVGLPLLWAGNGEWVPFGAWLALMAAGAIGVAIGVDRAMQRRRRRDRLPDPPAVGRVGVQRVRSLVAVLVMVQYFLDSDRFRFDSGAVPAELIVGAAVLALIGTNLLASRSERTGSHQRTSAMVELGLDTALVLVLTMTTDSSGFGWVLFSLPIVEAAVRFRVVGALVHWMILTSISLVAKVWSSSALAPATMFEELEALLDQLSVLFLVVVPASYLAEQLIGEVRSWQRATGTAVGRGQLLAQVADLGREIVRLDVGPLEVITSGSRSLGFDLVDIVLEDRPGQWRVVAGGGLPTPGDAGSGVRGDDLVSGAAYITPDDPDRDDARALADAGLSAIVAQTVSERDGRRLVLRVGLHQPSELTAELVEAFRLFAAQATVAFRNEDLMLEVTSVHDQLAHQATHDALTGLANRVRLLDELAVAEDPILLFLDLNGFKPVNDRMGHEAGDEVLRQVADRLVVAAPAGSLVARIGGDEFTVLLAAGLDETDAMLAAENIISEIERPFDLDGSVAHISTSVGVAAGGPRVSSTELIRRADVAMYEAKHRPSGPVQVEVYCEELDAVEVRRATVAAELARAIHDSEVRVEFQPVVDLVSGMAVGAEALVRWTHPFLGPVPPPEIIEAARAAGLQDELHAHVVLTAATCASEWVDLTAGRPFFVAVNASPEELGSARLVENVAGGLEQAGLSSDRFFVEISERLVTPASDAVLVNINALRALGVGLLLDDFGQGNTSLSYLHDLPVAGIKLDRSLVVNALRSPADEAIIESIVNLSDRLGHVVIAEGIEHDEQAHVLRTLGCPLAQGYYFGPPVPSDLVTQRLRKESELLAGRPGTRSAP